MPIDFVPAIDSARRSLPLVHCWRCYAAAEQGCSLHEPSDSPARTTPPSLRLTSAGLWLYGAISGRADDVLVRLSPVAHHTALSQRSESAGLGGGVRPPGDDTNQHQAAGGQTAAQAGRDNQGTGSMPALETSVH